MILRSLLFVPADSEKKLVRAAGVGADAPILDLEDSVAPESRPKARGLVREFLAEKRAQLIFIRTNPVDSDACAADLELATAGPAGFVIPKADGSQVLRALDAVLANAERSAGLGDGRIKLIAIATETARAVLGLADYRSPPPRLAALTWGAEDLSAALGASINREADGAFVTTYQIVRSMALIAAKAAGVAAIETLHADFRDVAGLERVAKVARRDGFDGMLAIHPDQVPVINAAFAPSADEVAHAERVVAAFATGASVASLDGKMLDKPHLEQAKNVLALSARK